jgi:hypothetical protein
MSKQEVIVDVDKLTEMGLALEAQIKRLKADLAYNHGLRERLLQLCHTAPSATGADETEDLWRAVGLLVDFAWSKVNK